jgi:hypothetical protein
LVCFTARRRGPERLEALLADGDREAVGELQVLVEAQDVVVAVDDDVGGLLLGQLRAETFGATGFIVAGMSAECEGKTRADASVLQGALVQRAAGVGASRSARWRWARRASRGAAHRGGDLVDQLRTTPSVELERQALVQAPAGDVDDPPLIQPRRLSARARSTPRRHRR